MAGTRPTFFAQLPADLNDFIARKLSYKTFNRLARVSRGGKAYVENMRAASHNIFELAGSSRKEFRAYLDHFFAKGSENCKLFKLLESRAKEAQPNPLDYALYALIADVRHLDKAKLEAAIAVIAKDTRLTSIVTSLNIINCYLTEQLADRKAQALKALIQGANGAYINLSGAGLIGDLSGLDWSYANLSSARVLFNTADGDYTGADFSDIMVGGQANANDLVAKGQEVESVEDSNCVIAWDFNALRGVFMFDPSPLIKDAADYGDTSADNTFDCNML